jgi:hypothetical protein
MLALDDAGNLLADGEAQSLSGLQAIFQAVNIVSEGPISAVLSVDLHCPSECIEAVKRICEEEGVSVTRSLESAISADMLPLPLGPATDPADSKA